MGDRGNVRFIYDFPRVRGNDGTPERPLNLDERADIFFYTHWGGTELPITVAAALDRGRGRWGDEAYLARIIFSEMIQRDVLAETGYGIAPYRPDEEHPDVVIDAKAQTANGVPFEDFINSIWRQLGGNY